ncbi:MAG: VWA domain-containing protein [bacterium]|nr:VWA domain-containing protein [bacterium]
METQSSLWKWLLLLLITSVMLFCGNSSSSVAAPSKQEQQLNKKWLDQEAVPIAIPENVEGEAQLTRNFYFIMDGSGSMGENTGRNCGGDQKFSDKMEGARWAIKEFLKHVPEDVHIGLYVFDGKDKKEVVPLGGENRQDFIKAVDGIQVGGGTPLARAIRYGTDQLVAKYKKQLGYGEYRLVVVTDGKANGIPGAAIYASRYGIPIYAIGLCVDPNHPLRSFSVSYQAADNFNDLSKGLQDTLAELPSVSVTDFEAPKITNDQPTN